MKKTIATLITGLFATAAFAQTPAPAAAPAPAAKTEAHVVKTESKETTVVKTDAKDAHVVKTETKETTVTPGAKEESHHHQDRSKNPQEVRQGPRQGSERSQGSGKNRQRASAGTGRHGSRDPSRQVISRRSPLRRGWS
ncbi:hypothetical protein RBA41_25420 [Massilia sp. CCM 9210]|uniref:hypothetical protein n=1 Tax=Massilia scottii TaxID=3057166 RepID=UPI002796A4B0|nr:hypothetical protein [Massilia sp. CCM 9210]MDQ1816646.1 hypothetical protein [Massilia sp. CCM 9210]